MALERANPKPNDTPHDAGAYLGRAAWSGGALPTGKAVIAGGTPAPGRAAGRHASGVCSCCPSSTVDGSGSASATGAAGGLGKNAKSADISQSKKIAKEPAFKDYAAERSHRFKLQNHISKLMMANATAKGKKRPRVSHCHWTLRSGGQGVQVIKRTRVVEGKAGPGRVSRAGFGGLQTCGSTWLCPCCSGAISEVRRLQLNVLLAWARKQGYVIVMVTLTARHGIDDSLADLLDAMKAAKRTWAASYAYKSLKASSLIGTVTATEVTGGGVHGWHPHFHMLMVLDRATESSGIEDAETLRQPWLDALQKHGLSGTGAAFDVVGGSGVGQYVAKWGAAEELTLSGKKKGRGGLTPMQLAEASMAGDKRAGRLFVEFGECFHGARQLVWSRGLKDLAAVEETTDEQIAEDAAKLAEATEDEELLGVLPLDVWKAVRGHRGRLLERCEEAGPDPLGAAVREIQGYAATPPPARPTLAEIATVLGVSGGLPPDVNAGSISCPLPSSLTPPAPVAPAMPLAAWHVPRPPLPFSRA